MLSRHNIESILGKEKPIEDIEDTSSECDSVCEDKGKKDFQSDLKFR